MKERPILFTGPMVRALRDGSKTQTRRVAKQTESGHVKEPGGNRRWHTEDPDSSAACPYGQPGDRLWVRESFSGPDCMERSDEYPALPPGQWPKESPIWCWADGEPEYGDWTRPRPSIHMPRWASRITLEIVSVRVERLQKISEADALAEGVQAEPCDHARLSCADIGCWEPTAKGQYGWLWESINGPGSWGVNPWVWAVEFRRLS